jgi:uncharacterized SAM-binding protein YcdF (DUF218 family)
MDEASWRVPPTTPSAAHPLSWRGEYARFGGLGSPSNGMSAHFRRVFPAPQFRRAATMVGALVVAAVAVLPFVPIGQLLGSPLEARFAPADLEREEKITGIIALGGDARRIAEAVKLAHRFPHAKLVITGAPPADYKIATAQDVARGRLILEKRARNTYENATLTKAAVDPQPGQRWLLVTSVWHMARAVGCFRKAGFNVLPWPIDQQPGDRRSAYGPLREWLGLLVYRLIGRTDALFPGPEGPV